MNNSVPKSSVEQKDYSERILHGSFWNAANYFITGAGSFLFSILLARFLHPENYGRYAFVMTIVNVSALLLDFGLGQALNKYIPKYFNDALNKKIAVVFFKKTTAIQTLISIAVVVLAWFFKGSLQKFFPVPPADFNLIFLATIVAIVFLTLNKQIINYVNAANGFKKVAVANLITSSINFVLLIIFYKYNAGLVHYLLIPAFINAILVVALLFNFRNYGKYQEETPTKSIKFKEATNYTAISYINLVILYIVYSYSEVFFLKAYSGPEEIAFYTLAFMLSMILSTLPTLFYRPLYNVQYELLEHNEEDRADNMTYYSVKFTSIVFLSFSILVCFFMPNLVNVLYGASYLKVSYIFPFCVFGATISAILSPVALKINNINKIYAITTLLTLVGALLNLLLDYLLIPKYDSMGAGYANFVSQIAVTVMTLSFVLTKIKVRMNWLNIAKIFIVNIIFASILLSLLVFKFVEPVLIVKVIFALVAFYVYLILLKSFKVFEDSDSIFFDSLEKFFPKIIYLRKMMLKLNLK